MLRVLELKWKFCMGSIKFWKIITFSSLILTLVLSILLVRGHAKTAVVAPVATITKPSPEKPSATLEAKKQPKLTISPGPAAAQKSAALTSDGFQSVTVKSGDSLASLFSRMKLSFADLMQIVHLPKAKHYSSRLKANQIILFKINASHQLQAMKFQMDLGQDLMVVKKGHRFVEKIVKKPMTATLIERSGTVRGSFSRSAENAGLNSILTNQFKTIFHGEVNFAKDVHARDHFDVLFKEYYVNGHPYHSGDIVAAKLLLNHKVHYAILFDAKSHHSYFDENGHALKSRFLMPPVANAHITGLFTYHRLDPVLHVVRPHLGIDFATTRGSPVKSIGDGQVAFSGKERGYGNTVIIQYGRTYKALYGHLQYAARGIHRGNTVKQGQVIGYVGSTGWSTGPHVHFELYVNGTPKNPLTMHAVSAQSVPRPYLARFKNRARQLIAKMKAHEHHA